MKYGAVLRAQVHAEALGLNPLENGEEGVSQLPKAVRVGKNFCVNYVITSLLIWYHMEASVLTQCTPSESRQSWESKVAHARGVCQYSIPRYKKTENGNI